MTQPSYALTVSEPERQRYRFMAERARNHEAPHWEAAGIVRGARVADVGCGPGAVLVQIAQIVSPDGEVVGVEPDVAARQAADDEIASTGVSCARVVDGSATDTGLAAASFNTVMIRHVLYHVGAAAPDAVRHAASLLLPGGSLYLVDTSMDPERDSAPGLDPDAAEMSKRYITFQRDRGCDVTVGARLGRLLTDAGLQLTLEETTNNVVPARMLAAGGPMVAAIPAMLAAGVATEADVTRWRAGLERAAATPGLTITIPQFIAVGRRQAA